MVDPFAHDDDQGAASLGRGVPSGHLRLRHSSVLARWACQWRGVLPVGDTELWVVTGRLPRARAESHK